MARKYSGTMAGKLTHTANHLRDVLDADEDLPALGSSRICVRGCTREGTQSETEVRQAHRVFEAIRNEIETQLRASIRRQSAGTCVESEADDIVQVVFMRLWSQLKSGDWKGITLENWNDPENLFRIRTTVFRTARFVRYRFYRHSSRFKTNVEDFSLESSQSGDHQLFDRDLRSALESCSSEIQDAFFLRLDGLSYREIAEHQGVSESVARLRHFRARSVLKKWLTDVG